MTYTPHLAQQDGRNVTAASGTRHWHPHPRPIWLLKGKYTDRPSVGVYMVFLIKKSDPLSCYNRAYLSLPPRRQGKLSSTLRAGTFTSSVGSYSGPSSWYVTSCGIFYTQPEGRGGIRENGFQSVTENKENNSLKAPSVTHAKLMVFTGPGVLQRLSGGLTCFPVLVIAAGAVH